jgi:hypothetical protein
LLGLRWIDVDLDAGRILVRQAYVHGQFVTPKSDKPREVPLGDDVIEELRTHRHDRGPLVFCDHAGKPIAPGAVMWPLERARKNAGLRPLHWHVLRHNTESSITPSVASSIGAPRRGWGGWLVGRSELSEALQEAQEAVPGAVAAWPHGPRCSTGESLLLHVEVGAEVHLGRLHGLVPEAERDDGAIDAALQELHGRGVSKHMWGHTLLL